MGCSVELDWTEEGDWSLWVQSGPYEASLVPVDDTYIKFQLIAIGDDWDPIGEPQTFSDILQTTVEG